MRLIGFDCADKSLGVSIVDINENWYEEWLPKKEKYMNQLQTGDLLHKSEVILKLAKSLKKAFYGRIKLRFINVFNMVGSKKVKDILIETRLSRLRTVLKYIRHLDEKIPRPGKLVILIEKQFHSGSTSRPISNAILNEFTVMDKKIEMIGDCYSSEFQEWLGRQTPDDVEYHMVGPSLKNQVYFGEQGKHIHFRRKYMSDYTANKNHAKYNLKQWVRENNCENLIKGIPNKNLDDAADSFLMCYVWYLVNSIIL